MREKTFSDAPVRCLYAGMLDWRNGRRYGLKIRCRKAFGSESRIEHMEKEQRVAGHDILPIGDCGAYECTCGRILESKSRVDAHLWIAGKCRAHHSCGWEDELDCDLPAGHEPPMHCMTTGTNRLWWLSVDDD